jgi:ABC-type antimicrobial peptide transport system permease subunit
VASRSEQAAKVAGALVAVASLGIVIYKSIGPLLAGYDTWEIATFAGIVAAVIVGAFVVASRLRRRDIARRIKRR